MFIAICIIVLMLGILFFGYAHLALERDYAQALEELADAQDEIIELRKHIRENA